MNTSRTQGLILVVRSESWWSSIEGSAKADSALMLWPCSRQDATSSRPRLHDGSSKTSNSIGARPWLHDGPFKSCGASTSLIGSVVCGETNDEPEGRICAALHVLREHVSHDAFHLAHQFMSGARLVAELHVHDESRIRLL
jgi:hypothetical protein